MESEHFRLFAEDATFTDVTYEGNVIYAACSL
jgi:hypothetical protein